MSKIRINENINPQFTLISNDFIDNFMADAPPSFALIYIFLLRCKYGEFDLKIIAEKFALLESDVVKAFKYWGDKGLISYVSHENGEIEISFGEEKDKAKEQEPKHSEKKIVPQKTSETFSLESAPKYSSIELEMYKESYSEINELFEFSEETLGKMLNANDLSKIYSFYDWLRLPVDVIRYLLSYCAESGHRRIKYIEAVAVDWAENGIKSIEQAEEYINIFHKDYRKILNALGLSGRNPAPKEIAFMDKWLKNFEMPMEVILEACDQTIMAVGKAQFNYTDKIITGWHESGVKTLEGVKAAALEFQKNKPATEEKPAKKDTTQRKNRFINYEQHVRDYDEMERLETELLLNKLKGKSDER